MLKSPVQIQFWDIVVFMRFMLQAKNFGKGEELLKMEEYNELHHCFPLLLRESLSRNRRMAMGKVMQQKHPFDIVIVEQDDLRRAWNKTTSYLHLHEGLWIQIKRIQDHPKSTHTLSRWGEKLQTIINNAGITVLKPADGILYLQNNIIFSEVTWNEVMVALKTLSYPQPYPYKQVAISISEFQNGKKIPAIHTWQIYPNYCDIGSVTDKDKVRLKDLYYLA